MLRVRVLAIFMHNTFVFRPLAVFTSSYFGTLDLQSRSSHISVLDDKQFNVPGRLLNKMEMFYGDSLRTERE